MHYLQFASALTAHRVRHWGIACCITAVASVAVGFQDPGIEAIPPGFRDDFVDGYDDAWMVLNPNDENVSVTKMPGMLTITTDGGGVWRQYDNVKNLFLIDTPLRSGNFVMTTRIVGFDPQANYQQAGLILMNDNNNYVKFALEHDRGNGGKTLAVVPETDGIDHENPILQVEGKLDALWLRVVRYNGTYIFAASRDGKDYTTIVAEKCDVDFPAKVGIIAKNGNGSGNSTPGIDACFDLFEIVPLESRPELEDWIVSATAF